MLFQLQQPNTMELRSGTYLQGDKYRIERTLSRGGFGIIYLAIHELLDRKVCIKEFFPSGFYNRNTDSRSLSLASQGDAQVMERHKQRFLKEARTIAKLDHQNIIHIVDVFQENNTAYYVMEYIEGESLSDIVRREGAMSETRALQYIGDLISATAYIHERNILHLDIKPHNIMVRKMDDTPILINFGLSKQYDDDGKQTHFTPVGFAPGFAPLEQYQQYLAGGVSTFSPCTDIYSIGATLYYLVMGKVPPTAANIVDDGLGELPKSLSNGTRKAIEQSMKYRRKDRPASAKALLNLLHPSEITAEKRESLGAIVGLLMSNATKGTKRPMRPSEDTIITPQQQSDEETLITPTKPINQKPQPHNYPKPPTVEFHANLNIGNNSIGGKIIIAPEQFIFRPHILNFGNKQIYTYNIRDIKRYNKSIFGFFDVIFNDGSVASFTVWRKQRVIDELEARRKQL